MKKHDSAVWGKLRTLYNGRSNLIVDNVHQQLMNTKGIKYWWWPLHIRTGGHQSNAIGMQEEECVFCYVLSVGPGWGRGAALLMLSSHYETVVPFTPIPPQHLLIASSTLQYNNIILRHLYPGSLWAWHFWPLLNAPHEEERLCNSSYTCLLGGGGGIMMWIYVQVLTFVMQCPVAAVHVEVLYSSVWATEAGGPFWLLILAVSRRTSHSNTNYSRYKILSNINTANIYRLTLPITPPFYHVSNYLCFDQ